MGKKKTLKKGICIITLSNNYDHQEVAFSMFNALYPEYNVYNIGLIDQKNPRSPKTEHSFYYDAPKRPGINKKTFDLKVLWKIVKKINSLDVEYVYFESEHIWNAFIMMLINKKFKTVQVIHDVIPHSDSKGKSLANKVTCKLADYVLIRNEKYKNELMKRYKVKEENIITMPLWRYYPPFNTEGEANGFLFFGRIRKYKGIETMVEIAKRCPNVPFYVVGSPDEESKPFVDDLRELSNVIVDEREVNDSEMEEYFKKCKAVILPYSSATQSGVIVDAYKYSKPVIAFDVGAISEQVKDGKSGFLVEENNVSEFAVKINEINNLSQQAYLELQKESYEYGYSKYSVNSSEVCFVEHFLK